MKLARRHLLASALALGCALAPLAATAQTNLRVFIGGQQRPDVMRPLHDRYAQQNPGVAVELEVGGATSELQQQYLTTVLTSQDSAIDVFLIDVIRPSQYAAAGWALPLDPFLGDQKDEVLARYLPVYTDANQVDGTLYAMPAFADALFLYYRTDLLDKYGLEPPTTWEELKAHARTILDGEGDPNLQGFSVAGRPIEGTVCTFLVPYWGAGGQLVDADGRFAMDRDAAQRSFGLWQAMLEGKLVKPNIAEVATDDVRKEFQAGSVVFAMLWGYAWNLFQTADDSNVKGKVGVVPLPAFEGGERATCIGGWQWAVSSFSRNPEAAVELVKFLSGPEGSKHLAINASNLPVLPEVYDDPEVLAANPWFAQAKAVVETARSRPKSPRYPEVSETIRTNTNAVLAGVKTPDAAIAEIESRLGRVLR
jgi:multiple sugar transport system substrate-binding protein